MTSYLFINPTSGSYSAPRFQSLMSQLGSGGIAPSVLEVRTPAEIAEQCAIINTLPEPPLVIVAGGDGTFNAVINALCPGKALVAIVPFGTSNVVAAELGITSADDAIRRIIRGTSRPLSIGVVTLPDREYRFVLMAGIGFDGAVVRDVKPRWKRLLKQGGYALAAVNNALAWDQRQMKVGTPAGSVECHSIIICNASRYGGNFVLEPESSMFKPGLTALCITSNRRSAYLALAIRLFSGTARRTPLLTRHQSDVFEITGDKAIQIDGDFIGHAPARITTEADFARIIV